MRGTVFSPSVRNEPQSAACKAHTLHAKPGNWTGSYDDGVNDLSHATREAFLATASLFEIASVGGEKAGTGIQRAAQIHRLMAHTILYRFYIVKPKAVNVARRKMYRFDTARLAGKDPMRKTLEAISLGALAVLFWVTYHALHGPDPLPDRIPTHFDAAGNPNGWGSPSSLLLLPAVALAIYLSITLVSRFPSAFNYPVRVTPENHARLEALALGMVSWLKMEMVCLFTWIQWSILEDVRQGQGGLSPALLPVSIVAVFGTVGWHIVAMFRAARTG